RQVGRGDQRRAPRARHLRRWRDRRPRGLRALLRDRGAHEGRHRPARRDAREGDPMTRLRNYRSAVWDEPLVMALRPEGRRGILLPEAAEQDDIDGLVPASMRRAAPPELPELAEFEVQRHYLHLSQMVLGMMGVNLFGTCTMKYNPRLSEELVARPEIA